VPGDQNGGTEGPPIDVQNFGLIHRVTLELSKYDQDVVAKLERRVNNSTGFYSGDLIIARTHYFRLLLHGIRDASTTFARNYLYTMVREPISFNAGSKFSTLRISFECHYQSGTLFNTTTS
jgi:hypothetical protein